MAPFVIKGDRGAETARRTNPLQRESKLLSVIILTSRRLVFDKAEDQHICPNISVEENTLLGVSPSGKVLDTTIIVEKREAFQAISFTICKTCKMFSFGGNAADGYFCNFRPFHLHLQMVHIPDLSLVEQLVHLQNRPLQRVSLGHVESASGNFERMDNLCHDCSFTRSLWCRIAGVGFLMEKLMIKHETYMGEREAKRQGSRFLILKMSWAVQM
ncbi:hypothetical protein SO802_017484 [Lithocarpus litseifolius]|uniref:Uncharacterized protein n=1 Tax=Lithocarpus litseifolius TaxID=425828 RepID=A0AAW2CIF5_9ROSI